MKKYEKKERIKEEKKSILRRHSSKFKSIKKCVKVFRTKTKNVLFRK